jgi:hypothetical protein
MVEINGIQFDIVKTLTFLISNTRHHHRNVVKVSIEVAKKITTLFNVKTMSSLCLRMNMKLHIQFQHEVIITKMKMPRARFKGINRSLRLSQVTQTRSIWQEFIQYR